MAFKVANLIVLVVTVAAELHHPLFYQDSLRFVTVEGESHDNRDSYSLVKADGSLYNPQFSIEGDDSPWNYLIPNVNSESLIPATYPEPLQALPLATPCRHDGSSSAYSTTVVTPTKAANSLQEIPFGYVPPVAKITVPAGYKIH